MTDHLPPPAPGDSGEFILYQSEDGRTQIEVRMAEQTVWLSQRDMADLFQTTPQNITQHIATIYEEGELAPEATCKDYLQVRTEGNRQVERTLKCYSLDVIIAVGYRVRSHRGTQFRRWATERLREFLIKGFALDDARLKRAGGGNYFEELLARIRDIRSSERVFWRKVLDIYATSIDYDPQADSSVLFFKTLQNKMHWAANLHYLRVAATNRDPYNHCATHPRVKIMVSLFRFHFSLFNSAQFARSAKREKLIQANLRGVGYG